MPSSYLPPKICPLMSGPSGQGGTSLKDCTSRCALYDHGMCALLALLRREPAPLADAGKLADGWRFRDLCQQGFDAVDALGWERAIEGIGDAT